ncbi:MAG TPA: PEP-CTERM sorting domain-containing protein [Methylomirabilota bacterium]|nr:PEP-CTERM sorting domain-containing protein [Methylomirabilota bacterium]
MNVARLLRILLVAASLMTLGTGIAHAVPVMHVDDSVGNLGTVDVATGSATVIGNMGVVMTDIAFSPTGQLFGLSFTGFYSINPATAASTFIGNHGVPGGNALVFGTDGTLYAAGFDSTSLFTINPATGAGTSLGNVGATSGGDLAFNGGNLFLATGSSQLLRIDLANLANSTIVGSFGVSDVFGLATGDNGVLYAVAGTQVFTVDTTTGAATNPVDWANQGLGIAFGQSFFAEAGAGPKPPPTPVPEPATLLLLGTTLSGMGPAAWRRRRPGSAD